MQKKYLGIILLIILSISLVGCATENTDSPLTTTQIPTVVSDARVITDGTLMPIKDVEIAFGANGRIDIIAVEAGQTVSTGDTLAQLANSETYLAQLENANLALSQAQKDQEELFENAPLSYVEAWQIMLDAKAERDLAQIEFDDFDQEDYQDRKDEAQADLREANNDLQDAEEDFADYADLDQDNDTRQDYQDALDDAKAALNEAQSELTEIENEYSQLEKNVEEAQARYEKAQNDMQALEDGPKQADLDLVQARINAAQAEIDAANAMLAELTITAPFDGTVVKINAEQSEFIAAGNPLIILADTSQWKVETDDLTEYDVVDIEVGQLVTIEPEASPQNTLTGFVTQINQLSELKEGDRTYTTTIVINDTPSDALRWGMTMNVIFE